MILFLYGTDGYRLKAKKDGILAEYLKKHPEGMNFLSLDASERGDLERFDEALKTVSFFDEKRLLLLSAPFTAAKTVRELIKKYDLAGSKDTICVLAEAKGGKSLAKEDKVLFALLNAKPVLAEEFESLSGAKLERWAVKEAAALGAKLDPSAAALLVSFVGDDTWRLRAELLKLANFSGSVIREDAVRILVAPRVSLNVFELIDALAHRKRGEALVLLARHLESGADPHYLLAMMAYQFRTLLRVKSLSGQYPASSALAKKVGIHPYVASKTLAQAKKFEAEEVRQKFIALAQMDLDVKNGKTDIVDGLYRFTFS